MTSQKKMQSSKRTRISKTKRSLPRRRNLMETKIQSEMMKKWKMTTAKLGTRAGMVTMATTVACSRFTQQLQAAQSGQSYQSSLRVRLNRACREYLYQVVLTSKQHNLRSRSRVADNYRVTTLAMRWRGLFQQSHFLEGRLTGHNAYRTASGHSERHHA